MARRKPWTADEEQFYRDFGRRVLAARRLRDMTQGQLAEVFGCSDNRISDIEKGRQSLTAYAYLQIRGYFGDDLFDELDSDVIEGEKSHRRQEITDYCCYDALVGIEGEHSPDCRAA